ncbi:MAG TPA: hypothetical protein VIA19_13825 [Burkholderiales bacterium]|jgi:hypothetical protein
MEFVATTFFLITFATVIGYFAYRILRYGGFKAAMFGASIEHTVGEVIGESQGSLSVALRVHCLRLDGLQKFIGIELVAKSSLSYKMVPITLSVSQAQKLASMLENATRTR